MKAVTSSSGTTLYGTWMTPFLPASFSDLLEGVATLGELDAVPVGAEPAFGDGVLALLGEHEVEEQLRGGHVRRLRGDADAAAEHDGAVLGQHELQQPAALLFGRVGARRN